MDVEKARVTGRAERLNAQAASFLTGRTNDVAERLFHGALVSRARMKTSEDEAARVDTTPARQPRRRPSGNCFVIFVRRVRVLLAQLDVVVLGMFKELSADMF